MDNTKERFSNMIEFENSNEYQNLKKRFGKIKNAFKYDNMFAEYNTQIFSLFLVAHSKNIEINNLLTMFFYNNSCFLDFLQKTKKELTMELLKNVYDCIVIEMDKNVCDKIMDILINADVFMENAYNVLAVIKLTQNNFNFFKDCKDLKYNEFCWFMENEM